VDRTSTLANTDALSGPASLVDDLDDVVRLPGPAIDWDFQTRQGSSPGG